MDDEEFWGLIGRLDWRYEGDDAAVLEPVVSSLAAMSDECIFAFDDALALRLHELDRLDIAERAFGDGYLSPDGFLYWRCVCVVNGPELFQSVLSGGRQPSPDLEFEAILYAASTAWARKHGAEMDDYPHFPEPSYETYDNREGWLQGATDSLGDNAVEAPDKAPDEEPVARAAERICVVSEDESLPPGVEGVELDRDDLLRLAFIQGRGETFSRSDPVHVGMLMGMRGEHVYSYLTILLGPVYWAYRRCYLPALVLLAVFVGAVAAMLALNINPRVFRFLPGMIAGAFFYRAYRWQADKVMGEMKAQGIDDFAEQEAFMRDRGGTSLRAALAVGVLYVAAALVSLAPLWLPTLNSVGVF